MVIFLTKRGWRYSIDGKLSPVGYKTSDEAKLALFDKFCEVSQDGKLYLYDDYDLY